MNSDPLGGDMNTSYALKKFKEAESTAQAFIQNQVGENFQNLYEIIIVPKIEANSILIITIEDKVDHKAAKIHSFGE